jgi:anti-anti-sigma regulatory factor
LTCLIRRHLKDGDLVFALSGRLDHEHAVELEGLLSNELARRLTLDLAELTLVDREAIGFLATAEARGVVLSKCPEYIRTWIDALR